MVWREHHTLGDASEVDSNSHRLDETWGSGRQGQCQGFYLENPERVLIGWDGQGWCSECGKGSRVYNPLESQVDELEVSKRQLS